MLYTSTFTFQCDGCKCIYTVTAYSYDEACKKLYERGWISDGPHGHHWCTTECIGLKQEAVDI